MRFVPFVVAASLGLAGAAAAAPTPASLPVLPAPASWSAGEGSFPLARLSIAARAPGERAAAARFSDLLARSGGRRVPASGGGAVRFRLDPAVAGAEAYRLVVRPDGVSVTASTDAGLFYGAETLWQLVASAHDGRLAAMTIDDRPSFAWRGVMLDSARHFQPAAYVEQLIDRAAEAKLNVFHWHLSDDQGWRLPINRYPRLTTVGAWRRDAGTGERVGGFYTKAEVRAVVAYAAARHVTVVPEIDVPGHATAMIAAYPALGVTQTPPTAPSGEYGVLPNLLNPNAATLAFMRSVLDEVMALFPGRYIHLGGDEAVKDQWRANPAVQAEIRALGLKNEDALQGWFTAQLAAYLKQHGRTLIGWDEILRSPLPADAAITSWHGVDGAITAAKTGHDAVLAPAPILYLDNRQSDAADEPPGRGEVVDWRRLYAFDPAPTALTADQRRHILGLQVNLWTEHLRTTAYVDRMIWPRAAVLAELGWSPPATRDWDGFTRRLAADLSRWRALGWRYDETPLAPELTVTPDGATLREPAGVGVLRYTRDGSAPTPASPMAAGALPVEATPAPLAAQAFLGDQPVGPLRRWRVSAADALTRPAAQMRLCDEGVALRLEESRTGPDRRVLWADILRPCWIWKDAPLDGVTAIRASVGHVPSNFADGVKPLLATYAPPRTASGELVIRRGGCDGPEIARLPFTGDTLQGTVPRQSGRADLCVLTAQGKPDPIWLLDRLTLETAR